MDILRLGLLVGALACLYVSWASWSAGYPPEIAMVRGVIGFVAIALVAYAGELIVATAPAPPQTQTEGAGNKGSAARARGIVASSAMASTGAQQATAPTSQAASGPQVAASTGPPAITGAAPADDQEANERLAA